MTDLPHDGHLKRNCPTQSVQEQFFMFCVVFYYLSDCLFRFQQQRFQLVSIYEFAPFFEDTIRKQEGLTGPGL